MTTAPSNHIQIIVLYNVVINRVFHLICKQSIGNF